MIAIKTALKKIPDKCNKCKFSDFGDNPNNRYVPSRVCMVLNNKEVPYIYSIELDCHGFIRPDWCPLFEIEKE